MSNDLAQETPPDGKKPNFDNWKLGRTGPLPYREIVDTDLFIDGAGKIVTLRTPEYNAQLFSGSWDNTAKSFFESGLQDQVIEAIRTKTNTTESGLADETIVINDILYVLNRTNNENSLEYIFEPYESDSSYSLPNISISRSPMSIVKEDGETQEFYVTKFFQSTSCEEIPGATIRRECRYKETGEIIDEVRILEIPKILINLGDPQLDRVETVVIEYEAEHGSDYPNASSIAIGTDNGFGGLVGNIARYNIVDDTGAEEVVVAAAMYNLDLEIGESLSSYLSPESILLARQLLFRMAPALVGRSLRDETFKERERLRDRMFPPTAENLKYRRESDVIKKNKLSADLHKQLAQTLNIAFGQISKTESKYHRYPEMTLSLDESFPIEKFRGTKLLLTQNGEILGKPVTNIMLVQGPASRNIISITEESSAISSWSGFESAVEATPFIEGLIGQLNQDNKTIYIKCRRPDYGQYPADIDREKFEKLLLQDKEEQFPPVTESDINVYIEAHPEVNRDVYRQGLLDQGVLILTSQEESWLIEYYKTLEPVEREFVLNK